MNQDFFKLKIKAFLHDPPEKPLILGLGNGHEATSERYIKALLGEDEAFDKDAWQFADHVASAADRTSFPMRSGHEFTANFRKSAVIKHPNSGAKFDLRQFSDIDADELSQNVMLVVEKIRKRSGDDPEKMFLYLWRSFADIAQEVEEGNHALGKLWNYLPADTRIPDHSVLDHSRIVSALAGAGITADKVDASLILFTIGPVQEFIAAARKTSDLWSGSYMLSWLSWQAMKVFCEKLGPDCILFPDLMEQPLVDHWLKHDKGLDIDFNVNDKNLRAPTLPNRFFAVVPKEEVKSLAHAAEHAVRDSLMKAGRFAFDELKDTLPDNAQGFEMWEKQLRHFTECNWASLDLPDWKKNEKDLDIKFKALFGDLFFLDNSHSDIGKKHEYRETIYNAYKQGGFNPNIGTFYGRFYEIVDKAVGARKSLKSFNPLEESGYRCPLIPGLAALTPGGDAVPIPGEYDEFWRVFYKNVQKRGKLRFKLGKNERLSPLAITKRFFTTFLQKEVKGFTTSNFISTHSLSVADFKLQLIKALVDTNSPEIISALDKFIEAARNFQEELVLEEEAYLSKLRYEAEKTSVNCQLKTLNLCTIPGELFQIDFYDGNFKDDIKDIEKYDYEGENHYKILVDVKAQTAKGALNNLIKEAAVALPSKYYAILYLDGDNMGAWLSGDNAPEFWKILHPKAVKSLVDGLDDPDKRNYEEYLGWEKIFIRSDGGTLNHNQGKKTYKSLQRPQAPTQHLAISRALNNYSLNIVRRIVEERFLGKLIYAGGDDVVAMISIGDALECAETLRAAFSGHLESAGQETLHDLKTTLHKDISNGYFIHSWDKEMIISTTLGPKATASCGIAIAHYMYPLKQAMADARKAEKYAKNELHRDAFAVNVVKRSGETFVSGAKWRIANGEEDEKYRLVAGDILSKFSSAIQNDWLSSKFIVDLDQVIGILEAMPEEAVLAESRRLFNQHNEGFNNKLNKEEGEKDDDFKERVKNEKQKFFSETIGFLITHRDELDKKENEDENIQKNEPKSGTAAGPALRNVLNLLDMAYYIGKGGGR